MLVEKTFVYDLNTLVMLDTIDTVPNPKGRAHQEVKFPSINFCSSGLVSCEQEYL